MKATGNTITTLIHKIYACFNKRDIDNTLAAMHHDVEWPNGMEGGYVYGHEEVRSYWTRQWQLIDPHVEPLRIEQDDDDTVVVTVRQLVKDLSGNILQDKEILHCYTFDAGLIRRMDIREIIPG